MLVLLPDTNVPVCPKPIVESTIMVVEPLPTENNDLDVGVTLKSN